MPRCNARVIALLYVISIRLKLYSVSNVEVATTIPGGWHIGALPCPIPAIKRHTLASYAGTATSWELGRGYGGPAVPPQALISTHVEIAPHNEPREEKDATSRPPPVDERIPTPRPCGLSLDLSPAAPRTSWHGTRTARAAAVTAPGRSPGPSRRGRNDCPPARAVAVAVDRPPGREVGPHVRACVRGLIDRSANSSHRSGGVLVHRPGKRARIWSGTDADRRLSSGPSACQTKRCPYGFRG